MELSELETKIIDLIAHGNNNKEMSEKLGVSTFMLKKHTAKIFAKYGVRGQTNPRVRLVVKYYGENK